MSSLARMWSKRQEDSAILEVRRSLNLLTTAFCVEDFLLIGLAPVTEARGSRDLESSNLTRAGGFAGSGCSSRG
ncbi:hypothetical protein TIFTF001_035791 [Ficus carica]|uniref:Uncharacterized protein n=1 Tax=Ficus carica TaxID=3494 RepID=A0AA88EBF6_FICCA|nr:hypothetical protein TIFTF001_035791 [Ficus carica]